MKELLKILNQYVISTDDDPLASWMMHAEPYPNLSLLDRIYIVHQPLRKCLLCDSRLIYSMIKNVAEDMMKELKSIVYFR